MSKSNQNFLQEYQILSLMFHILTRFFFIDKKDCLDKKQVTFGHRGIGVSFNRPVFNRLPLRPIYIDL